MSTRSDFVGQNQVVTETPVPHEFPGFFWLPETPETKVPGVLSISAQGEVRLSLIGELRSMLAFAPVTVSADGSTHVSVTEDSQDRAGQYSRVLGQSRQTFLTLEDGYQTRHQSHLFGGMPAQELGFNKCFEGVAFEEGEALAFDRLRVGLQHLTHWVGESGLTETIQVAGGEQPRIQTLQLSALGTRTLVLDSERELALHHTCSVSGDFTARTVTQEFVFEIRQDKKAALEELMLLASGLQAFVSLGTGRVCGYVAPALSRPDLKDGGLDTPDVFRRYVAYHARWRARDQSARPVDGHSMPFRLADVGGLDVFAAWLPLHRKFRHQIDMVTSTRLGDGLVSDKLLYRVAALEGIHKLMVPASRSLGKRLRALADRVGETFTDLVGDVDAWIAEVVAERNHIGHGSEPEQFEAIRVLHLAEAAYWLFVWTLLIELDRPAAFDRSTQSQDIRWLRRQLGATNPT